MRRVERKPAQRERRVLVVDDEPDIRELLELTLKRMRIDATAAASRAEARYPGDVRIPRGQAGQTSSQPEVLLQLGGEAGRGGPVGGVAAQRAQQQLGQHAARHLRIEPLPVDLAVILLQPAAQPGAQLALVGAAVARQQQHAAAQVRGLQHHRIPQILDRRQR